MSLVDQTVAPAARNPYADWAALTAGAYVPYAERGQWLAVHCGPSGTVGGLRKAAVSWAGWWIPPAYPDAANACTVRLTDAKAAEPTLAAWRQQARVLEADAGMASPDLPRIRLPALSTGGAKAPPAKDPAKLVVAVIDSACGFAQRSFCGPAATPATRLAAYWDQGGDAAPGSATGDWHTPPRFGYGRELRRQDIDTLLARHVPAGPVDDTTRRDGEAALYDAIGHTVPEAGDWSHGSHMLDLCSRIEPPVKQGGADPLAAAALVHVQLPAWALRDTSARWAATCVLDGLRYVLDCAGPAAAVVVNLSLGAFAGPHDGSSVLEQAIDDLITEHAPRLHVVVAAGNAALPRDDGTGRARPCHARAWLAAKGDTGDQCTLDVEIDLPDGGETFVELWLPQDAVASGRDEGLGVTVLPPTPPGETPRVLATAPGEVAALDDQQHLVAAVFNRTGAEGGTTLGNGGMALLAVGTTVNLLGWRAPTGPWRLQLDNRLPTPMVVDLWVQRRDVPGELRGHRAQYGFVGLPDHRPQQPGKAWTSDQGTLASLAHGLLTWVVAGVERGRDADRAANDPDAPWVRGEYSSAGQPEPQRGATVLERASPRRAPDVALPGTMKAAGFWTGRQKSLQGTSVAAAQFCCRLARAAARDPGANRDVLLQRLMGLPPGTPRRPARPDVGKAVLVDVGG